MAVMLKEGFPTDDMVAYHEAKAKGGAALTIIEAARVHPSGNSGRPAIRAYDPKCISKMHLHYPISRKFYFTTIALFV